MPESGLVVRQVVWPVPLPSEAADDLVRRLASERLQLTFEARSSDGRVSYYVAAPAATIHRICHTIETLTGALTVKAEGVTELQTTARLIISGALLPLLDRAPDTSRQLLTALSAAHFRQEELVLRVSLLGALSPELLTSRAPDPAQSLTSKLVRGVQPASGEVAAKLRRKREEPRLRVLVTAGAEAQSEGRRRTLLEGVLAAARTLEGPGTHIDFTRSNDDPARPRAFGRLSLTPRETLSMLALPLDSDSLPGMPPAHPKQLPLTAPKLDTERPFAVTTAPGPERELAVSMASGRTHIHIIGATGVGKSTTIARLVASSPPEQSTLILDPKTDLVEDILALTPRERWDDVVVIDPSKDGPLVGLNPFEAPGTPPEIIADNILTILHDLFPSAFGPRVSEATHAALITLAGHPAATLTMLPTLFTDPQLSRRLLAANDSPDLAAFWQTYWSMSDGAKSQLMGPVVSRLSQFLHRPQLRRALEQPNPKFHLGDLFTKPGRIVVVPLNAGILGSTASALVGSLIVSQLLQLTLARLQTPESDRHPVMVVVDEAQVYVHDSGDQLADALARSRAANTSWVVSHQGRAQMPRDVMQAIDGNTLVKIVYALQNVDDAKAMAAMIPGLTAEDIIGLPAHHLYAKLLHDGAPVGWASGRALPPMKRISDPADVRRHSIARWGAEGPVEPRQENVSRPAVGRRRRTTS